jgi:hypothetical protein
MGGDENHTEDLHEALMHAAPGIKPAGVSAECRFLCRLQLYRSSGVGQPLATHSGDLSPISGTSGRFNRRPTAIQFEGLAACGFEQTFSSESADLMVAQKDAVLLLISAVDAEVGHELMEVSGVSEVAGTVAGVAQMSDAPYFVVMGEDPRGFVIKHYRIIAGGPLTGRRQILLGKLSAKNFKKEVGESFGINDGAYCVVSIYETGIGLEDGGVLPATLLPLLDQKLVESAALTMTNLK